MTPSHVTFISKTTAKLREVSHRKGMCLFECLAIELEVSALEACEYFCRFVLHSYSKTVIELI